MSQRLGPVSLLILLALLTGACSNLTTSSPWEPVYLKPDLQATHPAGSWRANRQEAYQVPLLGEARDRLAAFLSNPANYAGGVIGSFEDSPHLYAINAANYELIRLHYLLDETVEGDALFKLMDPLDLLP